jgi:polar amino acid transport system substrate-binding protein
MQIASRLFSVLFAGLLAACAGVQPKPDVAIQKALAPSGRLRIGVYVGSPTSMVRDPSSGEPRGVSLELGEAMAQRLGLQAERVEFRKLTDVLAAIRAGTVDFTVTHATAVRAKEMDFTAPVLAVELGYLVPAGSTISALADVDRPGVRVGATQGSSTQRALPPQLHHAMIVAAPTLKAGTEMLARGQLDAFATNKAILFHMSQALPGSHVLAGHWGLEEMAIAIPKAHEDGMPFVKAFAADAVSGGLVAHAAARAGLRGAVAVETH